MLGLGAERPVPNEQNLNPEKLREWLEGIPEVARQREPADVLILVFVVETLKGGVNSNA
jgi:hypothetical protein